MDDAYGCEERGDAGPRMTLNGDYLCVEHEGQLRYIYRRVPPGAMPPAYVSRAHYAGELYSLAWVEDDA